MRIEDFNWETLYEKVDNFMKSIKANEYSIATLINKGITKSEEKNSITLNNPYTGGNLDGKFLVCKKNNRAYASYSSNDTELNNLCD